MIRHGEEKRLIQMISDDDIGSGPCAVCPNRAGVGRLMCSTHWRKVPGQLKAAVNRAYDAWLGGRGDLASLRTAQHAAIEAI